MRVEVKGLHSTYKHLASGETRVYWYAWRGGPRLNGKVGTPEFMASYNTALASRPAVTLRNDKVLEALVDAYLDSQNFLKLRDRTQADYRKQTRVIVAEFGSLPLAALADKRVAGVFLDWRDKLGKNRRGRPTMPGPCSRSFSHGERNADGSASTHASAADASITARGPTRSGATMRNPHSSALRTTSLHRPTSSRFGPASARAIFCG
jgi:hypothetical protein